MPEKMEVKLTEVEDQLCTLLDDCRNHLAETQGKNTTCRVAGGWVRDKVSGLLQPLSHVSSGSMYIIADYCVCFLLILIQLSS